MVAVNYDWDEVEDNIDEEYDDEALTVADYTTEPGLYGNLVSQQRSGEDTFFHYDALGSTLARTDSLQLSTSSFGYTAFGALTEQNGLANTSFLFIGRHVYSYDIPSNTFISREAVYSSQLGRLLNREFDFDDKSPVPRPTFPFASASPLLHIDGTRLAANESLGTPLSSSHIRAKSQNVFAQTGSGGVFAQERRKTPFEDSAIPFHKIVPPTMRRLLQEFPYRWADQMMFIRCKNECDALFVWYVNKVCGPQWAQCDRACPLIPRPIWGRCVQLIGIGPVPYPCIIGCRTRQDCRDDCNALEDRCKQLAYEASEQCRDELGIPRKSPPERQRE